MARWLLVALIALVGVAHADAPLGYDHNVHERDVFTHGGDPIACTSCHPMQNGVLVGRPNHASCFGACHGAVPPKVKKGSKPSFDAAQQQVCASCHAPSVLQAPTAKPLTVAFPPYVPTDFSLGAAHKSHAPVACAQCHPSTTTTVTTRPHRRCLGCHDGKGKAFAMTACQPCHTPGSGNPLPTKLADATNTVTSTFSHPKHAARGSKGAQCATCHAAIPATNEFILPRTPAQACAGTACHDGAPVFPITEACTRCHTTVPAKYDMKRVADPKRFSHAMHESSGLACSTCHLARPGNEVVTVGHAPCATCHADDFTRRRPVICSACHNSTEPWRKLVVDRGPADRTEFGAMLDHTRPAHQKACVTCHVLETASSQLRPPRGHRACTGTGCHATGAGPAPQLAACEGCHKRGINESRTAQRIAAAWSVRATFRHATHAHTDGNDVPCASCHTDLVSDAMGALPTPAKATCRPCHDGAQAFKLTGTTCMRCHPGKPL